MSYSGNDLEHMTDQYIRTALWTGYYELAESWEDRQPEPLDDYADESDLTDEQREWCKEQCRTFLDMIDEQGLLHAYRYAGLGYGQLAHDLVLTAQHQGAGFWDRGLGELGDKLTELCEGYDVQFTGRATAGDPENPDGVTIDIEGM